DEVPPAPLVLPLEPPLPPEPPVALPVETLLDVVGPLAPLVDPPVAVVPLVSGDAESEHATANETKSAIETRVGRMMTPAERRARATGGSCGSVYGRRRRVPSSIRFARMDKRQRFRASDFDDGMGWARTVRAECNAGRRRFHRNHKSPPNQEKK